MSCSSFDGGSRCWIVALFVLLAILPTTVQGSPCTSTATLTRQSREWLWINDSHRVNPNLLLSYGNIRGGETGAVSSARRNNTPNQSPTRPPKASSSDTTTRNSAESGRQTRNEAVRSQHPRRRRASEVPKQASVEVKNVSTMKSTVGRVAHDIKRWSMSMFKEAQIRWQETETKLVKPVMKKTPEMTSSLISSVRQRIEDVYEEVTTTIYTWISSDSSADDHSLIDTSKLSPPPSPDSSSASGSTSTSTVVHIVRHTTPPSFSMLLLPMRVANLALAAWLLSEALDYCGLIDSGNALSDSMSWNTSRLKQHLTRLWYSAQPRVTRWHDRIEAFWNRQCTILHPSTWRSRLRLQTELSYWRPKYVFGTGTGIGLVVAPLTYSLIHAVFPPLALAYGLAELNHFGKIKYGISISSLLSNSNDGIGSKQEDNRRSWRDFLRNRAGGGGLDSTEMSSKSLLAPLETTLESYRIWIKYKWDFLIEAFGGRNSNSHKLSTSDDGDERFDNAMGATVEKYMDIIEQVLKRSTTSRSLNDISGEIHEALDSLPEVEATLGSMTDQEYVRFRRVPMLLARGLALGAFLGHLFHT